MCSEGYLPFSSAAGIACLLLPFIAACLLAFGLNDALAAENVIEPFPVAVIDRDETVMSRMLIGQLRRIELFRKFAAFPVRNLIPHSERPRMRRRQLI